MASKYWLKLYHEMLDDPKVARLNDSAYRRFIECMLLAGELDRGGLLPPIEDMAWRLRVSETALAQDMTRLALSGLVELKQVSNGEQWFVSKFADRQAPVDDAERKRQQRKREKQTEYYTGHANVTDGVTKHVTIRDTDIDIDTDKDKDKDKMEMYSAHSENTPPHETMSAIACVVKETLAPGFNEDRFEKAAHVIMDLNAVDRVPGFADWWQRNSWYKDNGKANLTTFLDEYQNYLDGVERTSKTSENLTPLQKKVRELTGGK